MAGVAATCLVSSLLVALIVVPSVVFTAVVDGVVVLTGVVAFTDVVASEGLLVAVFLLVDTTAVDFVATGVVEVLFPESVIAVRVATEPEGLLAVVEALASDGVLLTVGGGGGL